MERADRIHRGPVHQGEQRELSVGRRRVQCQQDRRGNVGLGYYHTLSKQTQAYIMATWIGNDDLNQYNLAGGISATPALGASIFAATVGLKHSF